MAGVEQAIGAVVLVGAAFVVLAYGGTYLWHVLVGFPLARRRVRNHGIVVVGSNVWGDDIFVNYSDADWRRATFEEWRKVRVYEDESTPQLWPTRHFRDEELLC
jgi:hypothetical protein